jgi:hypothetical protein
MSYMGHTAWTGLHGLARDDSVELPLAQRMRVREHPNLQQSEEELVVRHATSCSPGMRGCKKQLPPRHERSRCPPDMRGADAPQACKQQLPPRHASSCCPPRHERSRCRQACKDQLPPQACKEPLCKEPLQVSRQQPCSATRASVCAAEGGRRVTSES